MNSISHCNSPMIPTLKRPTMGFNYVSFPFCPCRFINTSQTPFIALAKKKNISQSQPVLKPSIIEEVAINDEVEEEDVEDDAFFDEFEDDELENDDGYLEDEYFLEEAEPSAGDGGGGGGISLAGTVWDKRALEIAEEVALSFDKEIGIYAFKTLKNATVQLRIERLTNKSGSPTMMDIESFSTAYRIRLDEAESSGLIPKNLTLEVSSPGVERLIRIPQDLDRFKDRNMYVKYVNEVTETEPSSEYDGIFKLISFDTEAKSCIWGLADVRVNREKSGKGRPMNKKQKEWRLNTTFDNLRLVRIYSEI